MSLSKPIRITIDLADISTVPVPPDPNVVDTSDGNLTPESIFEGFQGYSQGELVVGIYKQDNPNIVDTGDGDITPADVVIGKVGYSKGEKITGEKNVDALIEQAYDSGVADTIAAQSAANITPGDVWTGKVGYAADNTRIDGNLNPLGFVKDPLWWDIKSIIEADATPGYIAKMAVLFNDSSLELAVSGADAYRMSDGAFYETTPATLIAHAWSPAGIKPDSTGGHSKYIIRYYRAATISTSSATQPSFGTATAINRAIGGWPIGIVCKDASIFMQNFLTNNYSLVFYDHVNCVYTGTNATGFVGGANCFCLQGVPESINYPSPFPTVMSGMYSSRVLKSISVDGWNWSRIGATITAYFANMYLLDTIEGVIDLSTVTTWGACLGSSYMLRFFTIRNCGISITLPSSVISYDTLHDLIWNGLKDMSGQTAPTLNVSQSWKALLPEDIAELTRKNWILSTP